MYKCERCGCVTSNPICGRDYAEVGNQIMEVVMYYYCPKCKSDMIEVKKCERCEKWVSINDMNFIIKTNENICDNCLDEMEDGENGY